MAVKPRKSRAELPLFQLIPNVLTLGATCAGMTAIRFAVEGRFMLAVALIVLAAALDGIDGRLARMLKSESALGAELDSLADFLNFGVAPALVLYFWILGEAGGTGWIATLVYAICCIVRLARFNVGSRAETAPEDNRFFTGVPAPAGAMLALLPMFVSFMAPTLPRPPTGLIELYVLFAGALMISRLPTFSFKTTTVYADHARFVLVGSVALVAALITYPWVVLTAFDVLYLAGIALSLRAARKARAGKKSEAAD